MDETGTLADFDDEFNDEYDEESDGTDDDSLDDGDEKSISFDD